jgi:hypothetical protein
LLDLILHIHWPQIELPTDLECTDFLWYWRLLFYVMPCT